jgi:hypothetical protein
MKAPTEIFSRGTHMKKENSGTYNAFVAGEYTVLAEAAD